VAGAAPPALHLPEDAVCTSRRTERHDVHVARARDLNRFEALKPKPPAVLGRRRCYNSEAHLVSGSIGHRR
jgi:hypothetical protein